MSVVTLYHSFTLPWTYIAEEAERLKRYVVVAIVVTAILGIALPFLPVKKEDRKKAEELPPRLAQLVMEKKKPKPPPPKKVEKKEEKKKEEKKEEKKEKKKEEKKKEEPKKPPEKTEAQKMAEARKKAASSGLLQFADELADLRDTPVKTALNTNKQLSKGGAQAKTFQRDILTSGVTTGSGGINTSNMSSGVGRSELAGRDTTKVESEIDKVALANRVEKGSSSKRPGRTFEDVQMVMDKNKGAIFSIYNRALRKDPSLQGKIVFELTVSPSGQVTSIRIVSSDIQNPDLEKKLMSRIQLFNFGSRDVDELIVTYPIDFLPP